MCGQSSDDEIKQFSVEWPLRSFRCAVRKKGCRRKKTAGQCMERCAHSPGRELHLRPPAEETDPKEVCSMTQCKWIGIGLHQAEAAHLLLVGGDTCRQFSRCKRDERALTVGAVGDALSSSGVCNDTAERSLTPPNARSVLPSPRRFCILTQRIRGASADASAEAFIVSAMNACSSLLTLCMRFEWRFFLVGVLLLPSCDTGLSPLNEPSGFRGVVRFRNWPPPDSVREIRIVAFERYPTDSAGIIATLLAGQAAVYPELERRLPRFVDSIEYEFTTKKGLNLKVTNYQYVIVAQQYGSNVLADWRPAGVHSRRPNSFDPAPVRVLLHRIIPNIDIDVDFNTPPPRPWR